MENDVTSILEEAVRTGKVQCRDCGNYIEPDCEQCYCGWKNPIVSCGMI